MFILSYRKQSFYTVVLWHVFHYLNLMLCKVCSMKQILFISFFHKEIPLTITNSILSSITWRSMSNDRISICLLDLNSRTWFCLAERKLWPPLLNWRSATFLYDFGRKTADHRKNKKVCIFDGLDIVGYVATVATERTPQRRAVKPRRCKRYWVTGQLISIGIQCAAIRYEMGVFSLYIHILWHSLVIRKVHFGLLQGNLLTWWVWSCKCWRFIQAETIRNIDLIH